MAFLLVVALVAGGCRGQEDDTEPAVVPKVVAFEGKLDPRFAGDWRSVDGDSALRLGKDGTLSIEQKITAANGKSTSRVNGTWLSSGDDLLFKYAEKSGDDTILRYAAKLSGKSLVLGQSGGRMKTTYLRK